MGCPIHSALNHFEAKSFVNFNNINDGPGGAHGVMVIVVGNGHGDTSSNTG